MFNDAQILLKRIIEEKLLSARGVVGFYPANSVGDDILIYEDDNWPREADSMLARFCGLRQQAEKDAKDDPYICLSDFVAPLSSGVKVILNLLKYFKKKKLEKKSLRSRLNIKSQESLEEF